MEELRREREERDDDVTSSRLILFLSFLFFFLSLPLCFVCSVQLVSIQRTLANVSETEIYTAREREREEKVLKEMYTNYEREKEMSNLLVKEKKRIQFINCCKVQLKF